jgi:hypothetical protein
VHLEGLGKLKISNDLFGKRTHDLPACSVVPQPTTLPHAGRKNEYVILMYETCVLMAFKKGHAYNK